MDLNDKLSNLLLGNKVEFTILGDNDTAKVSVYHNNNYNQIINYPIMIKTVNDNNASWFTKLGDWV